jgi:hypothetical protein
VSRSWLTIAERHPGSLVLSLGLLFVATYVAVAAAFPNKSGRLVQGDAVHYYVYLRSVVFDRDVQFQNEYIRLYGLKGGEPGVEWVFNRLPSGYVRNLMPIGPAIVWAPLYLLTCALVWIGNVVGLSYPFDGYGRVFQVSGGISGALAALGGVWVAFLTAKRWYGDRPAIWAALALWLGSSAWYYSLVSPTYSHASSMLATGLFVWVWARPDPELTTGRYLWLGALGGFAALVRWQDAIFLLAPVGDAVWQITAGSAPRRERVRGALLGLVVCSGAAALVFSPQMVVWKVLYGHLMTVP